MNIEQKPVNKHESRKGYTPIAIVDHISAGTMGSMYNTFANPNSKQASSHFGISREGKIVQYVDLARAAWTQGRIQAPTSDLIKKMGKVNPNLYCVSIEHEGYVEGHKDENGETVVEYFGIQGDITKEQYIATCWLHKYIQVEVEKLFGNRIPLNSTNVIGHYQIDSIGKPNCPGRLYPWMRLYSELAKSDRMTLEDYESRLDFLMSDSKSRVMAYENAELILSYVDKLGGEFDGAARFKLISIGEEMKRLGILNVDEITVKAVEDRSLKLYNVLRSNGKYVDEAERKFLLIHPFLEERGWL